MRKTPNLSEVNPRDYTAPTVARIITRNGVRFCVIGTDYGYLHTSGGDIRTWGSYSGARRAARDYLAF